MLVLDVSLQVVQYYQDSADKGNVDAQTAVGQVRLTPWMSFRALSS